MSRTVSPSAGKPYGVLRACTAWDIPRSSFYARRSRTEKPGPATASISTKRGPKPKVSDERLLELIRADLETSPFQGEGYRKVWARLKVIGGVRVSPKRALRVMRENSLLSPYRVRQGASIKHDGTIITAAPNIMWGTDGTRVFTVDDGWVWIFSAVEHWNAECVGWHVVKHGDRIAALEPISQGLASFYGSVGADAARGLALRLDHGPQYLSDHFQRQLGFWGITPSFGFLEEPQTNGVVERFFRTLKEQVIYGRIFHNVEELREAVVAFVERYNREWRLEKLGFLTPLEARDQYELKLAA